MWKLLRRLFESYLALSSFNPANPEGWLKSQIFWFALGKLRLTDWLYALLLTACSIAVGLEIIYAFMAILVDFIVRFIGWFGLHPQHWNIFLNIYSIPFTGFFLWFLSMLFLLITFIVWIVHLVRSVLPNHIVPRNSPRTAWILLLFALLFNADAIFSVLK